MKLFFYDLETTGVNHWKHSIHQIAGMVVINGEIVERFNLNVKPHEKAVIDQGALDIGGVTLEQIQSYPSQGEVYGHLLQILSKYVDKFNKNDKFHLVGYNNNSFDNHFFRAFFVQNNDQYFGSWFWSDSIDCMVLASKKLIGVRKDMPNFKQGTVAKYLNIEVDDEKLHDAMYDIEICHQIYLAVL